MMTVDNMIKIKLPLTPENIENLKTGDRVLLSGEMFTARDAAHKRLIGLIEQKQPLLLPVNGMTLYYTGPCPAKDGDAIGSCGPTTSGRMDAYTSTLLDMGLKGMIGKGERSEEVIRSMVKNKAVYFAAIGGAGAYYSGCVTSCKAVAFPELLSEAIHKLTVADFPVIVAVDSRGNTV